MYLKRIELQGFKSFATKTKFEFHNGITGIVGPNGSGKSNVADAVRWVFGEQKAKQLRGSSMQDVIFAGTQTRNPLSSAYVAITLDNSDHALDTDYEEVTISRRIYRSGESEYMINNTSVRLKDVQELFYDTGIGKEGYSIIGQGQIEAIISSKPQDRRELFDEAAGIVKYKRRKNTAQKKLISQEEDLIRVRDIISELERQVGPLREQSEKAREYLKLKDDLKKLDISWYIKSMDTLSEELSKITENKKITVDETAQIKEKIETLKKEYEQEERRRETLNRDIDALKELENKNRLESSELRHGIDLMNEQIKTASMDEERMAERLDRLSASIDEKEKSREEFKRQESEQSKKAKALNEEKSRIDDEIASLDSQIKDTEEAMEKGKARLLEIVEEKSRIYADSERIKSQRELIENEEIKLEYSADQIRKDITELSQLKELKENDGQAQADRLLELNRKKDDMLNSLNELGDRRNELNDEDARLNEQLIRTVSRLETLRNMEERYEGYSGSVQKVMERKKDHPGIQGVVADIIDVPQKYETAIETALGGNIRNVVTDDDRTARDLIDHLKKNKLGRVTFLPLTSVKTRNDEKERGFLNEKGVIDIAPNLVKADGKYKNVVSFLLGQIIVVDNVDNALALAKKSDHSLRIVTLQGELLAPGGSITGGAFRNSANLLGRRREHKELNDAKKDLEKKRGAIKDELDSIHKNRANIRHERDELLDEIKQAEIDINEIRIDINRIDQDLISQGEELKANEERTMELAQMKEQLDADSRQADESGDDYESESENIAKNNAIFAKKLSSDNDRRKELSEKSVEIVANASAKEQKLNSIRENIERISGEIDELVSEKKRIEEDKGSTKEEAEKKLAQIEENKKRAAELIEEAQDAAEKAKDYIRQKESMNEGHSRFLTENESLVRNASELERELERLEAREESIKDRTTDINSYMWEEYELTYHGAMEETGGDDGVAEDSVAALEERRRSLKNEMRSLGNVNVNAIEDFKEVNERYTFLANQRDDIEAAKANLTGIIEDLDKGMRKQFDREFARIRQEYQKVFSKLFGGGKGDLQLVEGEDLLEAGIEITAQPPGKKLQNMMQLSGGEKALAAICLLFAIQNLKPSPFCLLDEIEAALDEPNVDRFANYLTGLSRNTQFIVITHRRGSMNSADRLYGITMQEKGVSAQVSVNIAESEMEEKSA